MTKKLIVLAAVATLTAGTAGCNCCDWFRRGAGLPTTTAMPMIGDPCCPVDPCDPCDPCISCDPCAPGGCAIPDEYAVPDAYTTTPSTVLPGPAPATTLPSQ